MKKERLIPIILLALSTIFVILFILNRKNNIQYIYLGLAVAFSLGYAIYQSIQVKTERRKNQENNKANDSLFKNKINLNKDLNNSTKLIYDIYKNNCEEFENVLKKTSCDVNYSYDEEDKTYYLEIENILGIKAKDSFIMVLYTNDLEQSLIINKEEINVADKSYNEILELIINGIKNNVKINNNVDFIIKGAKWEFYTLIALAIIFSGGMIALIVYKIVKGMDFNAFIALLLGLLCLLSLPTIGIINYLKEYLKLDNGIYTYQGFFRHQSAKAKDIKEVRITSGMVINVLFIDKNNNVVLKYRDNGSSFKDGKLKKSLNYYKIPIRTDFESYTGI